MLAQVRNAVWLQDAPGQARMTAGCITAAGATQRSCSSPVRGGYTRLVRQIQPLLRGHPAIPTLRWFCADGLSPSVVDHTLTTHDGDHLTMEYSAELAPEVRRVLARPAAQGR